LQPLRGEIRWAIERVLFSPQRLAFLARGGLDDALELRRFLVNVVPLARSALRGLQELAERIPDSELRAQARFGLHSKAYHVAGACILATLLPSGAREHYVEIVAPLEAIYDFLDGLCDRHPLTTPKAFRHLHLALADALNPSRPLHDYYAYGPPGDDGDYLTNLVRRVRHGLARLGDYELLVPYFVEAATLYAETQTFSHLPSAERTPALMQWHEREGSRFGDLTWWEFGAAAGSQFQVYGPLYAAFCSSFDEIGATYQAYFPAFSAVHVLLDSFIDQHEDSKNGDVNWIDCYVSFDAFCARVRELSQRAKEAFGTLPMPHAHTFALRVMALFYLTHPKVYEQRLGQEAIALLDALA
jgi:tetraprenyl-beta-curcumene synthase